MKDKDSMNNKNTVSLSLFICTIYFTELKQYLLSNFRRIFKGDQVARGSPCTF